MLKLRLRGRLFKALPVNKDVIVRPLFEELPFFYVDLVDVVVVFSDGFKDSQCINGDYAVLFKISFEHGDYVVTT